MNENCTMGAAACAVAFSLIAMSRPAAAEVASVGSNGFEVRESAHLNAAPDKVYAGVLEPANWWNSEHTFSGSARNLTLEARPGGCWCEKLKDGGSVEHLRVIYVSPGKVLRLRGALGPFQSLPVDGVMTFVIKPAAGGGSEVSLTYAVGGYAKDGFDTLSKAADEVLAAQLAGLKKFIDGGPAATP
ncbi:MAG TPA: SRPBCC family protein [Steroidobacteraceae bacterium]|jgi:uncharacterized protein YndB with AHSA1/START domain|nr:SRPBCC family protein [Steroidobacteraceae bacterium]